jgi:uncharacterized membrane protein YozB (DUF420 family)
MTSAYIFQIQSALIFSLMCLGILKRKNRKQHVPIMATVLIWDIILILQIELGRSAVEKAAKAMTNPMMLNIHVSIAVSCVVLYLFLIFTGRKLLKNDHSIRTLHKRLGWSAFTLRLLTLITSFFTVAGK